MPRRLTGVALALLRPDRNVRLFAAAGSARSQQRTLYVHPRYRLRFRQTASPRRVLCLPRQARRGMVRPTALLRRCGKRTIRARF